MFSQILIEFLFRLTFGVAAAMALTSSRLVTSGFFRVHLWVLMGLQTLTALALYSANSAASDAPGWAARGQFWLALAAAIGSYAGAVIWMYEARWLGKVAVCLVAACALTGCVLPLSASPGTLVAAQLADRVSSGLLLGLVTTAMLLGHWYLNTPTMKLEPLKRLVALLAVVVGLRMLVGLGGTWLTVAAAHNTGAAMSPATWAVFVALRWLAGLVGVLALAGLTWQTLKIPNTQSATGILYAAVILAFIGELMSQLLSASTIYPV